MRRGLWTTMALAVVVLVTACQESAPPPGSVMKVVRTTDAAQVARGKTLFAQHCAGCHGNNAQGDANWRQRHPDGTFPPPPLNGSGHAWHHSHAWLHEVIHSGTVPQGRMPAWGATLSDQQIDDIIAWLQSLWPDDVYATWREMEQRNRTAN